MEKFKPYFWRLVLVLVGLLAAVLFLLLGFWKTILILICCSIGYAIGNCKDRGISAKETIAAFIQMIQSLVERWR